MLTTARWVMEVLADQLCLVLCVKAPGVDDWVYIMYLVLC